MREAMKKALSALVAGLALVTAGAVSPAWAQDPERSPAVEPSLQDAIEADALQPASLDEALPDLPGEAPASAVVTELAGWVTRSGDNVGLPFVIVDKVEAKVFVYGANGALRGWAPALVGLARGDDSVAGIGERPMSAIRPEERTTPAGRFVAGYGPAAGGGKVLWVDYATAISLHPVVTGNPKEHRLARLRSADPQDHRITYGCINVAASFYDEVVRAAFAGTKGVVYVLPETRPVEEVFPGLRGRAQDAWLAGGGPAPGVALAN